MTESPAASVPTTRFKDNEGREWDLSLTVDALRRARARGVDLGGNDTFDLLQQLEQDPVALCDACFAILEPKAKERNVTQDAFDKAMAGDVVDHAARALGEALVVFTPRQRQRALARKWMDARAEARARHEAGSETKADVAIARLLSGKPSSNEPASPASATPVP